MPEERPIWENRCGGSLSLRLTVTARSVRLPFSSACSSSGPLGDIAIVRLSRILGTTLVNEKSTSKRGAKRRHLSASAITVECN